MADVNIQLGRDGVYRIVCGMDHSNAEYIGLPIEWKAPNGKRYIAFCDLPQDTVNDESNEIESMFESFIYEAKPVNNGENIDEDGDFGDEEDEGDDLPDLPVA